MAREEIKVFCPATVSNVGPGFDLLGFALEAPGDELIVRRNGTAKLVLFDQTDSKLPTDPEQNVAAVAAASLLRELHSYEGFDLVFTRKIHPGSGIGSSAASCVAAVVGINELLGSPYEPYELLPFALKGELVASGSLHADNIAPALLGGITLIPSYDPLDIKLLPYPDDLWCTVVHPYLEIKTAESRKLIPQNLSLETALKQCGNLAGLVAGLTTGDYSLIGRSVNDLIAEPHRIHQLPDYAALKESALNAGSIGTGLSGSGPSVFSLCRGEEMASGVGNVLLKHFSQRDIESRLYVSRISPDGCKLI